ncbi:hypothetical protein HYX13_00500 [Candidatus Woesearchaeota archaeon]|nr:hypothetical protein [Candidatus Woesearchaeota archaeon]
MTLKITEQKENKLLQRRKEVSATVTFQGATPSNTEVTELLAKEVGVAPELVVIKSIKTRFGQQTADVRAVAYPSAEAKKTIEVVTSHLKKKDKAAPAAAEKK